MAKEVVCEHDYLHIETIKRADGSGGYNTHFLKVDRFFCRRCLHMEETIKEAWTRDTPDWY